MSIDIAHDRLLALSRSGIATLVVGLTMVASPIVFSEPAAVDALLLGCIVALPVLGTTRFGPMATAQILVWLVISGFGLLAAVFAPDSVDAIKHQLITLFLALGAFVLAGYVAQDPERRFHMMMRCYVAGITVSALSGIIGYFALVPGSSELFTTYGRARGTFKDPNVFGAALCPALAYIGWLIMREPGYPRRPLAALGLFLSLALLLSFSRGAWISLVATAAMMVAIAALRSRRSSDHRRIVTTIVLGTLALAVAVGAALQTEKVANLFEARASLDQSYDNGPHGRFAGQAKALDLILSNPFGIGAKVFSPGLHHEEAHQVYLSMALNTGWIGGLFYMAGVITTLAAGLWGAFRYSALQGAFVVAGAAFAGAAFEGIVIDTDHWRHYFIVMAMVWGLSDARHPKHSPDRRRHDPLNS